MNLLHLIYTRNVIRLPDKIILYMQQNNEMGPCVGPIRPESII
jgi:hypothetical protein